MTDFDARAESWDANPVMVQRARAVAEGIVTGIRLNQQMHVFEYGCGTGLLSFALQPHVGKITLADSSPGMLAVLDRKISSSGVRTMNAVKLDLSAGPIPDERYDIICTLMTLHHVMNTREMLAVFFRLLEEPGYLCVADLDTEDGTFHDDTFTGHKGFDRDALGMQARQVGFRSTRFETVFRMPKETDGMKKEYPMFLMIAQKSP